MISESLGHICDASGPGMSSVADFGHRTFVFFVITLRHILVAPPVLLQCSAVRSVGVCVPVCSERLH